MDSLEAYLSQYCGRLQEHLWDSKKPIHVPNVDEDTLLKLIVSVSLEACERGMCCILVSNNAYSYHRLLNNTIVDAVHTTRGHYKGVPCFNTDTLFSTLMLPSVVVLEPSDANKIKNRLHQDFKICVIYDTGVQVSIKEANLSIVL